MSEPIGDATEGPKDQDEDTAVVYPEVQGRSTLVSGRHRLRGSSFDHCCNDQGWPNRGRYQVLSRYGEWTDGHFGASAGVILFKEIEEAGMAQQG